MSPSFITACKQPSKGLWGILVLMAIQRMTLVVVSAFLDIRLEHLDLRDSWYVHHQKLFFSISTMTSSHNLIKHTKTNPAMARANSSLTQ